MANKGKFSQPRNPNPQKPQGQDLDMSFLDAIEDPASAPGTPIPDTLMADPLAEGLLPDEPTRKIPVPAAPVTAVPVATDPVLADSALPMDLDEGEDEQYEPETQRGAVAKNKKIILVSLCSVALVILIGIIAAVAFLLGGGKDDGLILNNVTVAGVNLGGMTQEEAVRVLRAATANTYTQQDMLIVLPEDTLKLSPADTGAKLDVEAAAEAAYLYGRTGTRAEREAARAQSLTGAHHIALLPYLNLNTDYIRQTLQEYCSSFTSEFVPSSAELKGEKPELVGDKFDPNAPCQTLMLNPGVPGKNMDVEKLYNTVLDAYSFNNFRVEIEAEGFNETPEPLDLEVLLEELSSEPVSASLDPETLEIIHEVYGYTFDLEKARELLSAAKPGDIVEVPMEYVEPEYTGASLFADVLGACETKHSNDENRNTNLRLACAAIDGMILLPGDLFDYNVVVGERTAERGYKAAAAYSSGQTVKEIGGGICQVSSTLYLAALRADLEIVSRTEHSYVSSYIPYGMDATVSWRGPEFRFRNNSEHAIRIDAEVSDGYVRINLMSIDDRDYYVEMEYRVLGWNEYETVYEEYAPDNAEGYKDGDVITTPYTGCSVRTFRCRYDKFTGNLISREEEAYSVYKSRDEVIAKIVDPSTEPSEEPSESPEDPTDGTTAPTEGTTPSTEETTTPTEGTTQQPTEAPTSPPADSGEESA